MDTRRRLPNYCKKSQTWKCIEDFLFVLISANPIELRPSTTVALLKAGETPSRWTLSLVG